MLLYYEVLLLLPQVFLYYEVLLLLRIRVAERVVATFSFDNLSIFASRRILSVCLSRLVIILPSCLLCSLSLHQRLTEKSLDECYPSRRTLSVHHDLHLRNFHNPVRALCLLEPLQQPPVLRLLQLNQQVKELG